MIFQACNKNPDALNICKTDHRSKEREIPPEEPIARELLDQVEQRFRHESQRVVDDWIRDSDEFTVKHGAGTILDQPPTEQSKCERLKSELTNSRFRQLASYHGRVGPFLVILFVMINLSKC
jgi:hypothetical protein